MLVRYVKCLWSLLNLNSDKLINKQDSYSSHLQGGHPDYLITVVEEVGENVKDGCLWKDQFLEKEKKKYNHKPWTFCLLFWNTCTATTTALAL